MSPLMLRHFWSLVEATQSQLLLSLDDSTLIHWLIKQLKTQRSLDHDEAQLYSSYIRSRLPLIRDLARNRAGVSAEC